MNYEKAWSKDVCGKTPLIKISEKIYGKLEAYNPSGSVKDRLITHIVGKALYERKITESTILCEATSGNTGIALSAMAASLGLPCKIFMPCNMSVERRQMMTIYGASIEDTPPSDFDAAIAARDKFLSENKNAWSPLQFSNPENIECHYLTTAHEIHTKLGSAWAGFVSGAGTGGTIMGVKKYINRMKLDVKTCLVLPEESNHGIQGIGDGRDFLVDRDSIDDVISIKTDDAINRSKQFSKESGYLVGISSGAHILAAERWVKKNNPDGIVVTMLCDRGERYMSIY